MATLVEQGTTTPTLATDTTVTTSSSENPSTPKVYVFAIDAGNLVNDEKLTVTIQSKVRGSGTLRRAWRRVFKHTQGEPNKFSPPVIVPDGTTTFRVIIRQDGGTARAFDWVVWSL